MSRVFEEFKDLITQDEEVESQESENTNIFKGEEEVKEEIKTEETVVEAAVEETKEEVKADNDTKPIVYESAEVKISEQLKTDKNQYIPSEPICKYLINKANEDSEFAKLVMIETKSMKKCFDYVKKEVIKEYKRTKNAWIDDDIVYNWAVDYFNADDTLLAQLEEAEKKKQEELKEKATSKKTPDKKTNVESTKVTNIKTILSKTKEKKEDKKDSAQLSLFEMGGLI